MYGLKQSARQWEMEFAAELTKLGFIRSAADRSLWSLKQPDGAYCHIAIYVDDCALFASDKKILSRVKGMLSGVFTRKDLGDLRFCLGMLVTRDRAKRTVSISQAPYITELLERYNMSDCNPTTALPQVELSKAMCPQSPEEEKEMKDIPYVSAVGALMWLMSLSRPDLAFIVGRLGQYSANPGRRQWEVLKKVLAYVKGTRDWQLTYGPQKTDVVVYSDASYEDDRDDRRCHSAKNGGAISWASKKQHSVVLSTCGAEYVALANATKEAMWLRTLLASIGRAPATATVVYEDNRGAIALAENPHAHNRTKHIDVKYHFTREKVEEGVIRVLPMGTKMMIADIGTKVLPRDAHRGFCEMMGVQAVGARRVGVLEGDERDATVASAAIAETHKVAENLPQACTLTTTQLVHGAASHTCPRCR
jgi:hypothetical protein